MRFAVKPRLFVAAAVGGVAIALAACGTSNPTGMNSSASSAPAASPSSQNIVQIASSNPDFSTLVTAVKDAGLASTLSGPGPYTVFAPTNEAFAKLPAGTLDTLLKPENKDKLAAILTYHVVSGAVYSKDIKPGSVMTVDGAKIALAEDMGSVSITDAMGRQAKVVKADIAASNGVIHVIDTVLLPS